MANDPKTLHDLPRGVKVFIDPHCRLTYASYYIQGLYDTFGREAVRFSGHRFLDIRRGNPFEAFDHYFSFMLEWPSGRRIRVAIDYHDSQSIDQGAYEWCDVYAKVNFSLSEAAGQAHPKLVLTSFMGCYRIWGPMETQYRLFSNLLRCGLKPLPGKKRFRKEYLKTLSNYSIAEVSAPSPESSEEEGLPYVYHFSTLWESPFCMENTNPWRKRFIDACLEHSCRFEGGFFSFHPDDPKFDMYKGMIVGKPSMQEYMRGAKRSLIAFNTPSMHKCHGFKLHEYIVMGKAIISTPFYNDMPVPMEHGRHIHFVDSIEGLRGAVSALLHDKGYRESLEKGSRSYFEAHATPAASIRHILTSGAFKSLL